MAFSRALVEGFYGRQWRWEQRFSLPVLLRQWGYSSYIYAPKGDASLRSLWTQPFTVTHTENLLSLGRYCRKAGIKWGLGLSPVGLQTNYTTEDKANLDNKITEIKRLNPDIIWVLFDDLPAGNPSLAQNQAAVVNDIQAQMPDIEIAMCPSYYSFDPILEELFGQCPDGYFEALNTLMDQRVDVLWTGNRVISEAYTADDCKKAAAVLGRKPLIWDNYPVNDGRKTSRFLHLLPFTGRSSEMASLTNGHAINPMNQFHLSMLVLPTLAAVYNDDKIYDVDRAFQSVLADLPDNLGDLMARDAAIFQGVGLDGLSSDEKTELLATYGQINHPAAREVCEWLQEAYRFDPACLTD
ncbi:Protein O-GlcNAcase [Zhongshania aliphaticivorans]|uniref:Protein O-GlcNAcase n=1 Tax=Zhongshania aliphaticivorans TaxID=1470434 RepID=A0A5S9NZ08_9GAMM|nr:beta-N-acetylglucosaminidase domain-containing protein [Zhongshania aliphaticivorans]CAA0089337.1 Protein O-GlcNAcase [Zhongshania aliphaticivorans]CAA0096050.1 Protein O-GlcNAcase [Zhongshania aliphaticivorans]